MAKKVILWVIIITVVVILVLLGSTSNRELGEKEKIKIGATLALTGNFAYIGQSEADGLQMAIDEINEKGLLGDKELVLMVEDNKGDPKEAVNSVNKMISVDNVDIVFSAFTSITGAIRSVVENNNKILIYNSTVRDFADENRYTFRDYVSIDDAGSMIAKAVKNLNYKRIGYIGPIDESCVQMRKIIENDLDKSGIELTRIEEFQSDEKDLKDSLLKLKSENLDVITSCSYRHSHILMRRMKELGMMDIPTIQGWAHFLPTANTDEMRELFKENGTIEVWFSISEIAKGNKQQEFFKKYKDKYGEDPSPSGLYSYDDGYVIAEAIKQCGGKIDNDCFADKINNQEFDGIAEKIKFDGTGNAIRKMILLKMNDDLKWEEVTLDSI